MDIYVDSVQLLLDRPEVAEWKDLRHALERAKHHKPVAWHFPVKACEAVGGSPDMAIPAVAAITCVHMAIMLVDDILDEDPRGAYRQMGAGKVANLAVSLNALGLIVLLDLHHDHNKEAVLELNEMVQRTAFGQNLDVMNLHTEQDYWAVTHCKSSPYFGAAMFLGALFGGANLELAKELKHFGELYGEIMQIHDDLNDSLAVPANVDWLSGRSPLPLLFAQLVDHPDRQRFLELRHQVEEPLALEEAQTILVHSGAISYSVNELIRRYTLAKELIGKLQIVKPEPLLQLVDEAIAPVKHLFTKVGADFSPAA